MRAWILGAAIIGSMAGSAAAQEGPPPGPPAGEQGFKAPGRGRLFISPMGEPFRGTPDSAPPHDQWFDGADANHDGVLTVAEMTADAARFFAALDMRHDGEIDPDDIERYETLLAPEIRVGGGMGAGPPMRARGGRGPGGAGGPPGGMRGGRMDSGMGGDSAAAKTRSVAGKQGAGRFGYLDYPQPITVADRNFNRGVDPAEFARAAEARFAMLDENGDGKLEKRELPRLASGFGGAGGRGRPRDGREKMPPKP